MPASRMRFVPIKIVSFTVILWVVPSFRHLCESSLLSPPSHSATRPRVTAAHTFFGNLAWAAPRKTALTADLKSLVGGVTERLGRLLERVEQSHVFGG
jgi:hypothetical protein